MIIIIVTMLTAIIARSITVSMFSNPFIILTKARNKVIISFTRGGFPPPASFEQINYCLNEIEHGGDKDDAFKGLVFIAVFLFPCHRFSSFL